MNKVDIEGTVKAADRAYAAALTGANIAKLEELLASDFVLIDVMSGSKVAKPDLIPLIASGVLKFDKLDSTPEQSFILADACILVGSSKMAGSYYDQAFEARSRYTHVFVRTDGQWKLTLAQGTGIAAA
jgi:ketosteroid isomerase-like protein